jgi:hypothetical protein
MKTKQQIIEALSEYKSATNSPSTEQDLIVEGWVEALEWVLGNDREMGDDVPEKVRLYADGVARMFMKNHYFNQNGSWYRAVHHDTISCDSGTHWLFWCEYGYADDTGSSKYYDKVDVSYCDGELTYNIVTNEDVEDMV